MKSRLLGAVCASVFFARSVNTPRTYHKLLLLVLLIPWVTVSSAATVQMYLDDLTGVYVPNYPPFENAGGKEVVFDIGQTMDLVTSIQFELQGSLVTPTYRDASNNIYQIAVNHNGALVFNAAPSFGQAWGRELGTESFSSDPNADTRSDYVINEDNTFYFSHIANVGDIYTRDLYATGIGRSHVVFYLQDAFDLQFDPRYVGVWDELTLVSPGLVTVNSMRIGISNETLFEPDPFGLDIRNPIPIPPAVWLFGTGLLGLIGIARKKAA